MNQVWLRVGQCTQGIILALLLIEIILALASVDPSVRMFRYQGF